jgi:hypothetical protein
MGYIVLKKKENSKITITNDFDYIFLIAEEPKKKSLLKSFSPYLSSMEKK